MSTWVLTGCAGFIGSHLLERVLADGKDVVGVDDLSSGSLENLEAVREAVGPEAWRRFRFITGDIRDEVVARDAVQNASVVLHNAALGSVPRSLAEPDLFHSVNIDGTHQFLEAARIKGVKRFIFASSSSVYGDQPELPKIENRVGEPLSPYAATKRVNELEAAVYGRSYGMETVGLRYFNVFGPRQNPKGPYAAVIPKWIGALMEDKPIEIFGDGTSSRDFCFVSNVVDANILAATSKDPRAFGHAFNIACGDRTDLNDLTELLMSGFLQMGQTPKSEVRRLAPRAGDIPHSHADIGFAREVLGYSSRISVREGLNKTIGWYLKRR